MKAAGTRIGGWTVLGDFAQTLALALASGVVFSMVIGAVVAIVASGQM